MPQHADRERDFPKHGEADEHRHGAKRHDQILANHSAGVLAETKRGQEVLQPVVHQHDLRLLQRGVRATRPHCYPHVRDRQARRVVDTVPNHGHPFAVGHKAANGLHLLFGFQFRANIRQAELALQGLGRCRTVARQHDAMHPQFPQRFEHRAGLRPDIVPQQQPTKQIAVADPYFGKARLSRGDALRQRGPAGILRQDIRQPLTTPQEDCSGAEFRSNAQPRHGLGVVEFDRDQALLFTVTGDSPRQWMRGKAFDGKGEPADFSFTPRRKTLHGFHLQFPGSKRSGFIESYDADFGKLLHGGAAAKQDAAFGPPGDGR